MLQSRHAGKLAWPEALVINSNRNAEKQKKKEVLKTNYTSFLF